MSERLPESELQDDCETAFIWTIMNFEMFSFTSGESLESPDFSLHSRQTPKFHLGLYCRGVNQDSEDDVSLYLVKSTDNGEEDKITYVCKLGIMSAIGEMTICKFESELEEGRSRDFDIDKIRQYSSTKRHSVLRDGNLTIFCEISVKNSSTSGSQESRNAELTDLSHAFAKLYVDGKHSDMELKIAEETFKIHKAILSSRFPALEKASNIPCATESFGTSTMDALLQYVYSGVLNRNRVNLFDLLKSDYEVPSHLKSLLHARKRHNIKATTRFKQKDVKFTWNIQNFSSLNSGTVLRSTLIGDSACVWTWFSIRLTILVSGTNEDNIVFSIERYSTDCKKIICKIKICDINKTFDHTFKNKNLWTLPIFLTKRKLGKKIISITPNDEASFSFEISVSDGSETLKTEVTEFYDHVDSTEEFVDDLNSFQDDLKSLFKNPKFSDITLLSGEEKFPAHKFVLCSRSSVFCEMLESEQPKIQSIIIEDLDSEVVKAMLLYIYSGKIELKYDSTEYIIGMYNAANKYKLRGLEMECARLLKSILKAENAGDILISADKWGDTDIKECVYDFARLHPQEIAESKAWAETLLKRGDLALEMSNRVY